MAPLRPLLVATLTILLGCAASGHAKPPRVVKASPDNGDVGVDPQTRELRVTFDQPMSPGGMSVVGGGEKFPQLVGKPRWRDGGRTFVYRVKLKPQHDYWLSINNARFNNFRNRAGEPAEPYPIAFQTGAAADDAPADEVAELRQAIAAARDAVEDFYSYRDRLGIDWDQRFAAAEKSLLRSKSPQQFAKTLGMVLAKAEDKHIWLTVGDETVPSFVRPMVANANFNLLPKLVPHWTMHGKRVATGHWDDGIGYLAIGNWHPPDVAQHLAPALERAKEFAGLIIDVRGNGGGNERLAQQVAGCFTDRRLLYGKHVHRHPNHPNGFGPVQQRWVEPSSNGPRIDTRVVVLTGPVVMSSCESFLLMMRSADAMLVGDRSQGCSGNPKPHDLGNGVVLYLPSWKDMTAEGDELEGVGIAPDLVVPATARQLERTDPVLEAALKMLREPPAKPRPTADSSSDSPPR